MFDGFLLPCWTEGCEQLIGYNYFNWFTEDQIEEVYGPIMKNEYMVVIVLKMEEMDGQSVRPVKIN